MDILAELRQNGFLVFEPQVKVRRGRYIKKGVDSRTVYRDRGCHLAEKCLECPLDRCIEDGFMV